MDSLVWMEMDRSSSLPSVLPVSVLFIPFPVSPSLSLPVSFSQSTSSLHFSSLSILFLSLALPVFPLVVLIVVLLPFSLLAPFFSLLLLLVFGAWVCTTKHKSFIYLFCLSFLHVQSGASYLNSCCCCWRNLIGWRNLNLIGWMSLKRRSQMRRRTRRKKSQKTPPLDSESWSS